MEEEPPPGRLTAPKSIGQPVGFRGDMVITGLKMPFWQMVNLFVKIWFAWLIATLIVAIILAIPAICVLLALGQHARETLSH
jgi:uncharacterized membrane protein YdfJ with MMPL/SSD domain